MSLNQKKGTGETGTKAVYKKRSQLGSVCRRFAKSRTAMEMSNRFMRPGAEHWFGTDHYGRDIFARIVYGGRLSLLISIIVIAISTVFGAVFGSLAAFYGSWIDNLIMRLNDIFYAIPYTLMAVCIVAALGNGVQYVCLACTVAITPGFIRLFRSNVMPIMNQEFVEAARSYGTSDFRIHRCGSGPELHWPGRTGAYAGVGRNALRGQELYA